MMTVNFHLDYDPTRKTTVYTRNQESCGVVIIHQEMAHRQAAELALFVKDAVAAELIRDAIETALSNPPVEKSNAIPLVTAAQ